MFDTLLIANRGEIACRIIATARRLGIETIAVHSAADDCAAHVALANRAVCIGGPAPSESYLRGDAIIAAALAGGAQAIHPGYGFLSENPEFVVAVEAAGLVFIGPSAQAIRAMGLKDAAKALMEKAGVPVVPGYHGRDQDAGHLAAAADAIGYPVLIKAIAGGGGKGMRKVDGPQAFADALVSARGEAARAFGNDVVLIEKYVEKPRHIEIQIFGDGTRAIHLFERDCSLQRRHQKVVEEAPAPGMTAAMRASMGAAAVRAAEAIGYKGAGTVEFIVDASDGLRPDCFWFMEMNTRLQVEHPVTEAVTGVDLVEWQLRIAAGEPLPKRQDDLRLTGHAFEARLYAEDVAAGFLPATGTLTHLAFPPGARVDSGVRSGDTISPWYDPMIAKIIVHGPTRAIALRQLARALDQTEVAGTTTNLRFLARLVRHPDLARGDVDTGLIARDLDALVSEPAVPPYAAVAAVLAAAGVWDAEADPLTGFSLWAPLVFPITLVHQASRLEARLSLSGPMHARVQLAAEGREHRCARRGGRWWIDDAPAPRRVLVTPGFIDVFADSGHHRFIRPDPLDRTGARTEDTDITCAPMPGLLSAVYVRPGQRVAEGDRLAVLEAMKMEHVLLAARAGIVAEVLAEAGAQIDAGAPLIRLADSAPDDT